MRVHHMGEGGGDGEANSIFIRVLVVHVNSLSVVVIILKLTAMVINSITVYRVTTFLNLLLILTMMTCYWI